MESSIFSDQIIFSQRKNVLLLAYKKWSSSGQKTSYILAKYELIIYPATHFQDKYMTSGIDNYLCTGKT